MSLEERLGHTFAEPSLLRLALTHRSVSSEDPSRRDNERLEFLGDAVLQLVVTDLLYESYPHLAEGQMAKVRAAVVSRGTLAEVARQLDVGAHVELAPSEEATGGREKESILADAVEAFLGGRIPWLGIAAVLEAVLSRHDGGKARTVDDVVEADRTARRFAHEAVERLDPPRASRRTR